MQKSKRLTSKSGLTIPKDMRADAGFVPGMAVDMVTTPDGILIKKHTPVCRVCSSAENVLHIMGMDICRSCCHSFAAEVMKHGKQ